MPAPSFRAASSAVSSSTSLTVAKPAGVQEGDLMVAAFQSYNFTPGSASGPSGWTPLASNKRDAYAYGFYYKIATATEPSSYTFTHAGAGSPYTASAVALAAYVGPASVDASAGAYGSKASGFYTTGSVTTTRPDTRIVSALALGASTQQGYPVDAAPAGTTLRRAIATPNYASTTAASVALGDDAQAAIGSSGTRAYDLSDYTGTGGEYTVMVAIYATNNPPLAPTWVTPQNTVIPVDADFDLDWDAHDPDPGDTQSEYVLDRWTLDGPGGARIAGSYLRVTVATPNSYRRITAGTLAVGAYEYKVATRDSQGVPTDPAQLVFSESLFVTAAESPDPPTFVAPGPIAGETIGTSEREYVISAPDVDASEWTLYADNAGVIDTSTVLAGPVLKETGDLRRHTFTGLANNTAVWAQVEIKDGGLWSQPTQQRNPVAYSPPPAPTYTLLEDPAEGEIVVQINNPAPGAGEVATSYNDVFITDPGKPEQRRATEIPANGAWTYQLPPSGFDGITTGVVRVEAVADNGTRTSSA